MANETTTDYIVVGAGFSGLSAARGLKDRGHSVIVLEAQNYFGGRAKTINIKGVLIDSGAMWIDGWSDKNPTKQLAMATGASHIMYEDFSYSGHQNLIVDCYDAETSKNFQWSQISHLGSNFVKISRLSKIKSILNSNASMIDAIEEYISYYNVSTNESKILRFAVDQGYTEVLYSGPSRKTSFKYFGKTMPLMVILICFQMDILN